MTWWSEDGVVGSKPVPNLTNLLCVYKYNKADSTNFDSQPRDPLSSLFDTTDSRWKNKIMPLSQLYTKTVSYDLKKTYQLGISTFFYIIPFYIIIHNFT